VGVCRLLRRRPSAFSSPAIIALTAPLRCLKTESAPNAAGTVGSDSPSRSVCCRGTFNSPPGATLIIVGWSIASPALDCSAMMALSEIQWILIAALVVVHLVSCYRVPRWAKLTGRSPVLWFFMTLLFTSLPAGIVHQFDRVRGSRDRSPGDGPRRDGSQNNQAGASPGRCAHCGERIAPGQGENTHGVLTCPNCGMVIDERHLA